MHALLLLAAIAPALAADVPTGDASAPSQPVAGLSTSLDPPGHRALAVSTAGLVITGVGVGLVGGAFALGHDNPSSDVVIAGLLSVPPLALGSVVTTMGGLNAAGKLSSAGVPVSRVPGMISALCYGSSWIALMTAGGWDDDERGMVIPLALGGLLYSGAVAGGVTQYVLDVRATRRWQESQATATSETGSSMVGPVLVPVIGPDGTRGIALTLAF